MTNGYRFVLDRAANDAHYKDLFSDKGQFYSTFSRYIHRDVLSVEDEKDKQTFFDFCDKHNRIIIKPRASHRGIGVEIIDVNSEKNKNDAWDKVIKDKMVVEEVMKQNSVLASPHPQSLNTLRIATAIDKTGVPHMMVACLRMGYGKNCIDNASGGGIFALINPETGIIESCARDLSAKSYAFHPTSGVLIVGMKIPKWDELKQKALEVTAVVPQMRYIGWDWAMNDKDEWELIEGNNPGGVHMLQLLSGKGLKKEYDDILLGS